MSTRVSARVAEGKFKVTKLELTTWGGGEGGKGGGGGGGGIGGTGGEAAVGGR